MTGRTESLTDRHTCSLINIRIGYGLGLKSTMQYEAQILTIIDSVDVELVIFYFIDKTSHISHVAGGVLRRVGPGGLEPDQLGAWTPGQTAALMLPHHQAGYHNFNTLQHCQLSVKPPGTFKSIVSEPLQRQNCCPFLA